MLPPARQRPCFYRINDALLRPRRAALAFIVAYLTQLEYGGSAEQPELGHCEHYG